MKKGILYLFVSFSMLFATSCVDSDNDFPTNGDWVTVRSGSMGDYYFELDNHKRIYPGDKSRIEKDFKPNPGKRAVITFRLLKEQNPPYEYNAKIYQAVEIYTQFAQTVTQEEAAKYKNDPLEVSYRYAILAPRLTHEYLSFTVNQLTVRDKEPHYYLLYNPQKYTTPSRQGYLDVELHYDNGSTQTNTNVYAETRYLSFLMEPLMEHLLDKDGVVIHYAGMDGVEQTAEIEMFKMQ